MIMNYISILGQLLAMLVIFIATKFFTYKLTEEWGLPKWLDYRPWNCSICSCFWTLMAIYTVLLILGYKWVGIGGIILAVLNAIAMKVEERRKTIDVNQYHLDNETNENKK